VARKRAGEVLAWRNVLNQISDDDEDERREAVTKLDEAVGKLRKDIEKAFQHYVYLVRAGDLAIEFQRFDDDTKSSLHGDQVWAAIVEAGRASIAGGLAADYLAALLDGFDRALTPKEVVQSFYKNPTFPLVPSTDEVRRTIYDLLHTGWELVDADGVPLAVASPAQISINSINQTLRRRIAVAAPTMAASNAPSTGRTAAYVEGGPPEQLDLADDPYRADAETVAGTPAAERGEPVAYKRYVVDLTNRSVTSPEAREQVWQLLRELAKVLDSANVGADHQLLSLSLTLTTAEGHQGQIESKAQEAGARVRVEDDDF
jgi:hypothetical protein